MVQLTDAAGTVTQEYEYDAFGNEQSPSANDTNTLRYCGEYFDAETGTIYLRARYYDPRIGRFTSADTVLQIMVELSSGIEVPDPLSLNRYTYCHNNPVMYVDYTGNMAEVIVAGATLTVAQIAVTGAVVFAGIRLLTSEDPQQTFIDAAQSALWESVFSTNEQAYLAIDVSLFFADRIIDYANKKKPVNLPSYKKIALDMDHIMSGHSAGDNRGGPNKDRFPAGMTVAAIEKAIREAYHYGEKLFTQGDRVFMQGPWEKSYIQMWVNKVTGMIETAWPK